MGIEFNFTINGQNQIESGIYDLSGFRNLANMLPDYIAKCGQYGGKPEQLATPLGYINSCMTTSNDNGSKSQHWLGNIVFGTVKNITVNPDGSTQTMTIRSYQAN